MAALEILSGFVTAPGSTLTALTMSSGNSLTLRNNNGQGKVSLLNTWVDVQTADTFRLRSPNMHDNVQGLRFEPVASDPEPLMPFGFPQDLVSQDTIVAELAGSGTASDIETAALLIYYENLPGIQARLSSPGDIKSRMKHILTVENTLALGTSGGYSGEEAINAEFDLLKANTDYAILGYTVSAECAVVRWRGSETGNLGIGGPGNADDKALTRDWFVKLSEIYNLPLIPVFNSANASSILIDGVQDENGTDVTVNTILAELS